MKVLITGVLGQVGRELLATAPAGVQPVKTDRATLDITDAGRVRTLVGDIKPSLIINAAAYTAVDKAENERELAFRVNRDGAANLAEAARRCGARLIHISTDYVFDGTKSTPYRPADKPNPLGAYGASKLAGEQAVTEGTGGQGLIVRTSWIYAAHGHNFVRTMLRLIRERPEVRVVADQIGTPTHARALAEAIWAMSQRPALKGTLHWTEAGVASWYDVAAAIRSRMRGAALAAVIPISTSEYPTAAPRPAYSVLDKSATWQVLGPARHWLATLTESLDAMPEVAA